MKINIITKNGALHNNNIRMQGGMKPVWNAVKGLKSIGVECVYNEDMRENEYNWIHDDLDSYMLASVYKKPVIAGPNLVISPIDFPIIRLKPHPQSIYIMSSDWNKEYFIKMGFNDCKLMVWTLGGIDTENFCFMDRNNNNKKALIYFKNRDRKLLNDVVDIISGMEINYDIMYYGMYTEEEYKNKLKNSSFGIWIGRHESFGFALLEALSTGLPLIVLEPKSLLDEMGDDGYPHFNKNYYYLYNDINSNLKVSSAPYFDDKCGIKIDSIDKLNESILIINNNPNLYSPREYIIENLSLQISAIKFKKIASLLYT